MSDVLIKKWAPMLTNLKANHDQCSSILEETEIMLTDYKNSVKLNYIPLAYMIYEKYLSQGITLMDDSSVIPPNSKFSMDEDTIRCVSSVNARNIDISQDYMDEIVQSFHYPGRYNKVLFNITEGKRWKKNEWMLVNPNDTSDRYEFELRIDGMIYVGVYEAGISTFRSLTRMDKVEARRLWYTKIDDGYDIG